MNRPTCNGRLVAQMEDALRCITKLAQRGLAIARVELGTLPRPRIIIDAPYLEPGGLKGGMLRINPEKITYATDYEHCQVEWEVSA
ncbi:hypothetical protein [Candidatus Vondammii sp. HM_W22]|uniref:hypothetical protein n=1 Tax=Candidatus Vondammii sp. HM_W22 TaxID=2687299 RepID=UPI001F1372FD|nr:hypothetical protein [Candidatus Vondammii sp. HM_W22]